MWLPEDRETALVWQQFTRMRCARCGTWDWEWDENPQAWVAGWWTCPGCKSIDQTKDSLHEKQATHGMHVRMFKED